MEQETVSPPQWTGFARLAGDFRQISDAPICDAVERQWLAEGREVPRRPGPSFAGVRPVNGDDLFRRA
ncbi:hypothetical protein ACFWSF_32500 [Streptomyces sp. NPDC058611]|uniref:hypothetical protein n=1 Tax=unclassified Streptomyces TaxID=2593676 RepID=UPI0036628E9F